MGRGESREQGSSPNSVFTCCATLDKSQPFSEMTSDNDYIY